MKILAVLAIAFAAPAFAFDLSGATENQIRASRNPEAIAAIPEGFAFRTAGKLTVAVNPGSPPLSTYANDATTIIGADPELAQVVADALGLELDLVSTAWADWPLGLASGKYDVALLNIGVTEERKDKFDFSTYRQGLHGFFVRKDSGIEGIAEPADIAGLRIIVGSGTNQERILLGWDALNTGAGLEPASFQYYDDEATSLMSLQSGRADVIVQPHAQLVYIAARDGNIERVGTLSAGWPERSDVAIASRKGSGLADALTIALNGLIADGTYARVLGRWNLESEALERSETNPPGLPRS